MIDDAMVARMFSACWNTLGTARCFVAVGGDEFRGIRLDETVSEKVSIWGVFPEYDSSVIVESKKKIFKNGDVIYLNDKKRRIGEVEPLCDGFVRIGLEARFSG